MRSSSQSHDSRMARSRGPKAKQQEVRAAPQLTVESLRHHFSVHDGDVDEQQQDDEEIIQEAQQAEQSLGQDVQRRRQVGDGADEAEKDPDPEHPEEAAHREHLPEGVAEERGDVYEPVHQLGGAGQQTGEANINQQGTTSARTYGTEEVLKG